MTVRINDVKSPRQTHFSASLVPIRCSSVSSQLATRSFEGNVRLDDDLHGSGPLGTSMFPRRGRNANGNAVRTGNSRVPQYGDCWGMAEFPPHLIDIAVDGECGTQQEPQCRRRLGQRDVPAGRLMISQHTACPRGMSNLIWNVVRTQAQPFCRVLKIFLQQPCT